eukprot:scaffold105620_cov38-Tisochrysis_lutea.AAC.3
MQSTACSSSLRMWTEADLCMGEMAVSMLVQVGRPASSSSTWTTAGRGLILERRRRPLAVGATQADSTEWRTLEGI